jgi:hypothetical protein
MGNKYIEILLEDNMPNQLITAMYVSCRHDLMAVRVQPEI